MFSPSVSRTAWMLYGSPAGGINPDFMTIESGEWDNEKNEAVLNEHLRTPYKNI